MNILLRLISAGGIPATIAANVIALAHLIRGVAPSAIEWRGLPAFILNTYNGLFLTAFNPVQSLVANQAQFALPGWSGDLAVLYAASAAAFTVGGPTITEKAGLVPRTVSAIAGLAWPIAIGTFIIDAVRKRTLTNFAARHGLLFGSYVAAVAAAFAGAVYLNHIL